MHKNILLQNMRRIIFIIFYLISLETYAQQRISKKRSSVPCTITDFIGTWKLIKYADRHLNYTSKRVQSETLIFTNDSIFVFSEKKKYVGTWKFEDCEPIITIKETRQFNYNWISRDTDEIFFTTEGLGYYKYFQRIKKK